MEAKPLDEFIEAALEFRKKHPDPVTFQQVVSEVRRSLRQQPQPRRDDFRAALDGHASGMAAWITDLNQRPIARNTATILEEWILEPGDRRSVDPDLRSALAGRETDPEVTAAARLLGALDGGASWTTIGFDRLSPIVLSALVSLAADQHEVSWLVSAACAGPSSIAKTAREVLSKAKPELVEAEIAQRLREWPAEAVANASVLARLVGAIRFARQFNAGQVRVAAIEGAMSVPATREKLPWVGDLVGLAVKPSDSPKVSLDDFNVDTVRQLLGTLAALPAELDSPRVQFIQAVAASSHLSALADPVAWTDVRLETIGELLKVPNLGADLLEVAGETVFRRKVLTAVSKWQVWQVFELVGRWPSLGRFVTADHVLDAAHRGGPSAQMLAEVQRNAATVISRSLEFERSRSQHLAEKVQTLEVELAASHTAADELRAESDRLRDRIRSQAGNSRSALDAELRQARIDTLDVLVGAAESLRNLAAVGGETQAAITGLHADMVRRLASFGVEVVGHEGERREPRPDLDGQPIAGPVVEVIAPAYVLAGDPVTPLRHAVVRSVST